MPQDQDEPLSPRMRGVFTAETFAELLPQHKKIMARVVSEVIVLAKAEVAIEDRIRSNVRGETQKARAYHANVLGRQPHQSFLIDGPKGAGKTTLLLNLRCALAQIGPSAESRHVAGTFEIGDLESYWPSLRGQKLAAFQQLKLEGNARYLVHALPVIRPDSMEMHESIMECVLAEMTHQLDQLTDTGEDRPAYLDPVLRDPPRPVSQAMERKIERARKLKQQLQTHVAKGWYFAKQLGVEALVNDSMNFDEYIERRASEAVVSHRRISNWMPFVIDYLDLFDSEMLAIFIDDTDISAELAADILHTIRMYFSHPRMVVVMAGNLHSIRQRLLVRAMSQQAPSHKSLRAPDSFTARFWRDFDRETIEEYLSKVLPRPYRHFIPPSSADGEQVLLRHSFVDFCAAQMRLRVGAYLRERRTTLQRSQQDARLRSARYESLVRLAQRRNRYHQDAENHIALWLLRNHYAAQLTPRTARHVAQFRAMVEPRPDTDLGQDTNSASSRRVAVALFTHPNNFNVIQRQSDFDSDASEWINRQTVSSRWRGGRWIRVNELPLPFGTPSYEYLLYRLDLELARPTAAWLNPKFPTNLLPEPSGRKIWGPELWQREDRRHPSAFLGYEDGRRPDWQLCNLPNHKLRLRQELLGLALAFSSPVIPANCMYFKDLRPLPDLAWTWDPETDPDYRRFFDQFPVRNVDNIFRLDRFDPRNDYFRDIVLVFASYPLVQPIPSEEFVTGSVPLHEMELSDYGNLVAPSADQQEAGHARRLNSETAQFARIRRLSKLMATLYRRALSGIDRPILHADIKVVNALSPRALVRRLEEFEELKNPAAAERVAQQLISEVAPRYHRILNDVRRAWHAMRILEADINSYTFIARMGPPPSEPTDESTVHVPWPKPFNHARNDTYFLMTLEKFRTLIGLPSIEGADRENSTSLLKPYQTKIEVSTADTRYWIPIGRKEGLKAGLAQPFSGCVGEILKGETSGGKENVYAHIAFGGFGQFVWHFDGTPDSKERAELYEREADFLFTFQRPGHEGKVHDESSVRDILFGERTWSLTRGGPKVTVASSRNGFTQILSRLCDPGERRAYQSPHADLLRRNLFDTRKADDAHCSRMYRTILLTLWGLSPCLSSLIHLTVMGRHYWWQSNAKTRPGGQSVYLAQIAEDLDDWEVTIAYAMTCVVALAMAIEVNLDADFTELTEKEAGRPNKFDQTAFCSIPDISIAPLGLRIYGVDYPDPEEPRDAENDAKPPLAGRKFDGIIGDTLLRLQLALYYIAEVRAAFREVWDPAAYTPPAGDPSA